MTESEAIKELKIHIEYLKYNWKPHPDYWVLEALNIGIESLEKQIPKKPDFTEDKEFALCPCCNGKSLLDKQKYCDNCVQKLDWK